MEHVLDIYERSYDVHRPVICFDERPCQLLADTLIPIAMKAGRVKREDYHYERKGTCVVMMAIEPLTGQRIVSVTKQKTKKDYTEFMIQIAERYKDVQKIVLVQDNLNTHTPGSFYEVLKADEAFALAQRFEMVYTPKGASWLNMVEIELSVLSKQCLDRRIDDIKKLRSEVIPWVKQRNQRKATIQWAFSKNDARKKLNKFYETIKN